MCLGFNAGTGEGAHAADESAFAREGLREVRQLFRSSTAVAFTRKNYPGEPMHVLHQNTLIASGLTTVARKALAQGHYEHAKAARVGENPETGKWLPNGARAKAGLSRKILGACWGTIHQQVKYKAKRAGALVLDLPPHYSSQKCSHCGHTHPDNRLNERFICKRCGYLAHADSNAGRNMAASAIERVRMEQVVNKVVRRVAFRKKGGKDKPAG